MAQIKAIPLSKAAYQPYGVLIEADESQPFKAANMGTAKRFNNLCRLENLRQDKANLNLCVFRCSPLESLPLEMKLLEKHQLSTQVFMPMLMPAQSKYLAIVCLGADKPDLASLAAFVVDRACGISYHPGVWHYPMTAIGACIDFACLVYEDETADDCCVVQLAETVRVFI